MSLKAGALLWNRQLISMEDSGPLDVDTGLRQLNVAFGEDEPPLGIAGTTAPADGTTPASRVQVIPMAPLAIWDVITHSEPYFNTTTNTVHVVFNNSSGEPIEFNACFWDPHTMIGPGDADTYHAFNPCFVPETLVWTPLGAVPIQMLKVGDRVLAQGPNGVVQSRPITQLHRHTADHCRNLDVNGSIVATTDNHPFMVGGHRWAPAGVLVAGDQVHGMGGIYDVVGTSRVDGDVEVMNIEVDELHTYFVGESKLLVHNK